MGVMGWYGLSSAQSINSPVVYGASGVLGTMDGVDWREAALEVRGGKLLLLLWGVVVHELERSLPCPLPPKVEGEKDNDVLEPTS